MILPLLLLLAEIKEPTTTKISDPDKIALIHATIIDGTGAARKTDQTILISDGKIERTSSDVSVPEGYEVIDCTGKTILPGLIGVHNHLHMPGNRFLGEQGAKLYLAGGVTTIQTCGSASPDQELNLASAIEEGHTEGPQIFPSAPYITGPGGNPNMIIPRNESHLRDTMRYWVDKGVRWFKVYRHVTPEDLAVTIDEAHRLGARVTGHLCSVTFEEAVAMGIDGIEHGLNSASDFRTDKPAGECGGGREYMDSMDMESTAVTALFHKMIRENVFMTSTLAIFESSVAGRSAADQRTLDIMSPPLREQYYQRQKDMHEPDTVREQRLKRIMAFERTFVRMGGILVSGVDPGRHVLPGFGDQRNFELLVEAGFSVEETVKIMTGNGATVLGLEDRGIIAAGKRADLIILTGDLTTSPANIRQVESVYRAGIKYDPQSIIGKLAGTF